MWPNSTYDEYTSELLSGHLSWTPVHESELFWKENVTKLNEKDYAQLKYVRWLCRVASSYRTSLQAFGPPASGIGGCHRSRCSGARHRTIRQALRTGEEVSIHGAHCKWILALTTD